MDYEKFGMSGIKLYISKEHRFGTDSVLLAGFAGETPLGGKTVCDLCGGCGIISIALFSDNPNPPKKIYSVDIAGEATNLLTRTVRENNALRVTPVQGDLREQSTLDKIGRESADLVTANPPYYRKDSGLERVSAAQKTARYETDCELKDVVKAAAYLLKFGGWLKMSMTAERLADCVCLMREHGIEPKKIVLIPAKKGSKVRLLLISGKKGGKAGMRLIIDGE